VLHCPKLPQTLTRLIGPRDLHTISAHTNTRPARFCRRKTCERPASSPKGPPQNNIYTMARAPGGQMQGAATQAMRRHRRGAATKQMPARRRAPSGCGPQARWLRCSLLTYNPVCSSLAPCQRAWGPAAKCNLYSLTGPQGLCRSQAPPAKPEA
jgi:hypothetical protein